MATAQEVMNKAAKNASLVGIGQTLEAEMNADVLVTLNRMIARWRNNGVDLGVDTLTATQTIYVDDADLEAIEAALTLRLKIIYERNISVIFAAGVDDLVTELQAKYQVIRELKVDRGLIQHRPFNRTFNINTG